MNSLIASVSFSNPVAFLAASMAYEKSTEMIKSVLKQLQHTCSELYFEQLFQIKSERVLKGSWVNRY